MGLFRPFHLSYTTKGSDKIEPRKHQIDEQILNEL